MEPAQRPGNVGMKTIVYSHGARWRLIERRKRHAERGQLFLDQESGQYKISQALTADKFYCYQKQGDGRYYISRSDPIIAIRDAKRGKIVCNFFDEDLADRFLDLVNSA